MWQARNYYIFRNKTSGMLYVGQSKKDINVYRGSGGYWVNHCKKYGGYTKENIETVWSDWFDNEELAQLFLDEFEDLNPKYYLEENTLWANKVRENTLDVPIVTRENTMKSADTKRKNNSYEQIGKTISKSLTGLKQPKVSASRKNKVSCYDSEGNYLHVTKEEYDSRDDLVGINKGHKMPERSQDYRDGASERMSDRVWIHSIITNEKKFIKTNELQKFLDQGFLEGYGHGMPTRKLARCEHCEKEVDVANFKRWHGSNCKMFNLR
jgi:hypothetical protein